jgi:uncharacterized protein
MMRQLLSVIWLVPRNVSIAVMRVYRFAISPLYGQVCRYHPSCSRYALEAYQQHGFVRASALTLWRLLRCNPWSRGGIDDVPAPRRRRTTTNSRGFVRAIDRKA